MNILVNKSIRILCEGLLIAALCLTSISIYAEEFVYVSSQTTKLYEQQNFKSKVLTQLTKSTKLVVLKKDDIWIQVNHGSSKGWITRYAISETAPIKEKIGFFTRIRNFFSSEKRKDRTSVISTAGGIRGLADGDVKSSGVRDVESLKKLETIIVTPDELNTFIDGSNKKIE